MWLKEIAPSNELRKWFAHDPEKWGEFRAKYFDELDRNRSLCVELINKGGVNITLIFSAKNEKYNNAVALKEYLISKVFDIEK